MVKKKKKCWRILGDHKWKRGSEIVEVSKNSFSGEYQTWLIKKGKYSLLSEDKLLPKKKAAKIAESYMKKHNVC